MALRTKIITDIAAALGSEDFVIVELTADGPKPVYDAHGDLLKFTSGPDAAREAARLTIKGRKFQPRRVKDDGWQDRELKRFANKEYQTLPWSEAAWWGNYSAIHGSHFPHVSTKNSIGLMAFTETDAKGSADVQTPIKPGKYLERYFSDILDPYIIRDLCTIFSNKFEDNVLMYANTEDEFEELYTKGPSSCMSHDLSKFASHIHPVRVYAAGDLALVYMKRDGRVVARALCWPEKKIYSRVYGDGGRIEPLLATAGYKKGTPFGAKLQRVITWQDKVKKTGNQAFVAPHIDDVSYVCDHGDHLTIGHANVAKPKNGVQLVGAAGITEWVSVQCGCCKKTTGIKSQLIAVIVDHDGNTNLWCDGCVKDKAVMDKRRNRMIARAQTVEMYDGTFWWRRDFDAAGFTCEGDGKRYPSEMMVAYRDDKGKTRRASSKWFKANNGHACATCGSNVTADCSGACKAQAKADKERQFKQGQGYGYTTAATWSTSNTTGSGSFIDAIGGGNGLFGGGNGRGR